MRQLSRIKCVQCSSCIWPGTAVSCSIAYYHGLLDPESSAILQVWRETAWTRSIVGGFQATSKGSGKSRWNGKWVCPSGHMGEGPPCPPGWGDRHASWAEIDKIRARAAASQQETMAPGPRQGCPRRLRRPTGTRAGTAPAKLHGANWAAMASRHQVPELVPGPGLLGAGRCSWAKTESCRRR